MQSDVAAANTTKANSLPMSWFQIILSPTTYAEVPNAVAITIGIKCRVSDVMGRSTLASANGRRNRAATKDFPFQDRPTSPLRFTALFVGVSGVSDRSIVEECNSIPSWTNVSSHNVLPNIINVNPSSASKINIHDIVDKIAAVINASPDPRKSIPIRSIQSRPFPQLGIQAASAK